MNTIIQAAGLIGMGLGFALLAVSGLLKGGLKGEALAKAVSAAHRLLSKMSHHLVFVAEQNFGGGTGQLKASAVLGWLTTSEYMKSLPVEVRAAFDDERLQGIVDLTVAAWLNPQIKNNLAIRAALGKGGDVDDN